MALCILVTCVALIVSLLYADAVAPTQEQCLPDDVVAKIYEQHGLSIVDQAYLSVTNKAMFYRYRDRVVQALFHDGATPDCMFPPLIRALAVGIGCDPATRQYVTERITPQLALGLYHRIMWSEELDVELKADLILTLVRRLDQTILNRSPSFCNPVCLLCYSESVLPGVPDSRIPVSLEHLNKLSQAFLDYIHAFVDGMASVDVDSFYVQNLCHQHQQVSNVSEKVRTMLSTLQDRYPPPFCNLFPYSFSMPFSILVFGQFYSDHIRFHDHEVVLALSHFGVTFPILDYLSYCKFPKEAVPHIVPLLGCDNRQILMEAIIKFVLDGRTDHAIEMIKIPYVEQCIRSRPQMFLTSMCPYMKSANVQFFEFLIELPYVADIINVVFDYHIMQSTLLFLAMWEYRLDIVDVLLQVPQIDVFVTPLPGANEDKCLFDLSQVFSFADQENVRKFLHHPRVSELLLSDVPALKKELLRAVPNETVLDFHWFWVLPDDVRSQYQQGF